MSRSVGVTACGVSEESGSRGREVADISAHEVPGPRATQHQHPPLAVLMELQIYVSSYAVLLRFGLPTSISIHRVRNSRQKIHTNHLYRTVAPIMFNSYYSTVVALGWLAIRGTSAVRTSDTNFHEPLIDPCP